MSSLLINLKGNFFEPSDRAQIGCADSDENDSHLKQIGPNPPQSNTKPIRIEGRQPSGGRRHFFSVHASG